MDTKLILDIGNLNCGDVLKAMLLNALEPDLKLNIIMVRKPAGDLESAAAKARESGPLVRFQEDHVSEPQANNFRFENIDPAQEAKNRALAAGRRAPPSVALPYDPPPKKAKPTPVENKSTARTPPSIETVAAESHSSEDWLTTAEAAALRKILPGAIYAYAHTKKWRKRKENGKRAVLFHRDDVMRGVKQDEA